MSILKNDNVMIIRGAHKGQTGRVIKVFPANGFCLYGMMTYFSIESVGPAAVKPSPQAVCRIFHAPRVHQGQPQKSGTCLLSSLCQRFSRQALADKCQYLP